MTVGKFFFIVQEYMIESIMDPAFSWTVGSLARMRRGAGGALSIGKVTQTVRTRCLSNHFG